VTISKMNKKILISFALIIIFFLVVFYSPLEGWLACETGWIICPPPSDSGRSTPQRGESKYIKIAGQNIKVDLALTSSEQSQGLGGRSSLGQGQGMLFVFDKIGQYPFWMKDMNFPIDMIWIGEDMKVVYIKKNALPQLYPETYGGEAVAKYILEVSAGFSDKNNLQAGDRVEFTN